MGTFCSPDQAQRSTQDTLITPRAQNAVPTACPLVFDDDDEKVCNSNSSTLDLPDHKTIFGLSKPPRHLIRRLTAEGGLIKWDKVADYIALLPREVKLKIWNGVFKSEADLNQPQVKRFNKILRTFVMLHFVREYKKDFKQVTSEIKEQIVEAVREPAKYFAHCLQFHDENRRFFNLSLQTIHLLIRDTLDSVSNDRKKQKKITKAQENYSELTSESLQSELNEHDFLKTSYMQYLLYAYQIDLSWMDFLPLAQVHWLLLGYIRQYGVYVPAHLIPLICGYCFHSRSMVCQIDEALMRYYSLCGSNYDHSFERFCSENSLDDQNVKLDITQEPGQCLLIHFDNDFPIKDDDKSNRAEQIQQVLYRAVTEVDAFLLDLILLFDNAVNDSREAIIFGFET